MGKRLPALFDTSDSPTQPLKRGGFSITAIGRKGRSYQNDFHMAKKTERMCILIMFTIIKIFIKKESRRSAMVSLEIKSRNYGFNSSELFIVGLHTSDVS